jgi:endonuclease YncB( thermonuclease family)
MFAGASEATAETPACEGLEAGPSLSVARVLDGETLLLHDGTELRLVGALAPRASDAGAVPQVWPSEIAARAELEALVIGKTVEITFGGERQDRYGRHLGHAFIASEGGEKVWVQGQMLRLGLARAYTSPLNRKCAAALLAAEATARDAGLGLWSEAAYRVRSADEPNALVPLRGTFQVVEGRIRKATRTRSALRLEFGEADRRFGLGVYVPAARGGASAIVGGGQLPDAAKLENQRIRVRGWVEERGTGPSIDLTYGGDLELLDGVEAEPEAAPRRRPRGSLNARPK